MANKKYEAQVKKSCTWPKVQAGGEEWVKGSYKPVPDHLVGEIKAHPYLETRQRKDTGGDPYLPPSQPEAGAELEPANQSPFASKEAEKYASDWRMPSDIIKGTGQGGKITKKDIEAKIKEALKGFNTSKSVLKKAIENGVDLGKVKGTGNKGVITAGDLQAHLDALEAGQETPSEGTQTGQEGENAGGGGPNEGDEKTDAQGPENKGGEK